MDRRTFCIGAGSALALFGIGALTDFTYDSSCVRPPGGQDESRLLAMCIRCEKCIGICPRDIIVPSHLEDGFKGFRTPMLNFDSDYCDWCEAHNSGIPLCEAVCPTGALHLNEGQTRETLVMGRAEINEDMCLGWRLAGCKFCYDSCPFEAIVLDDFNRPVLIDDKCLGCGACESVCVSLQNGSISAGATERAIVVRHP